MQNTVSYQNQLEEKKESYSSFRGAKTINLRELTRQQELLQQLREEKAHIQSEIAKRQKILALCSSQGSVAGDEMYVSSATKIQSFWRMKQ